MELLERKQSCVWLSKFVCKIPDDVPCPDDCDLMGLAWEKEVIMQKIKEENENIKLLKKDGMWKNRSKIQDKIGGLITLNKGYTMITGEKVPVVLDGDMVSHADMKQVNFPKKGQAGWR